ncbi:MAG: phenylalanine--tRNA ligase subunit beta [Planctomycetota bacterium]
MDISLAWLNQYLSKPVTAEEADELLTQAGFPIEGTTPLDDGDVLLDVEVTSNRGDCLSHVGCAREVAAMSRGERELVMPVFEEPDEAGDVNELLTLTNHEYAGCPLFTARVITGCTIGPSPDWLVKRLEAVGQRSINNAVDVTNFITLELGNPSHVFDRAKLAGHALEIRYARKGEKLRTLDDKDRVLEATDLVVADADRATSLAGVIGGGESEVSGATTEIVFEMATWDPVTVRTAARRMQINTDAGYRFQRGIDPRTIDYAARRAVRMIAELTGGTIAGGVLEAGPESPGDQVVTLRPSRVKTLIGIDVPAGDQIGLLSSLGIGVEQTSEDELACTIPPWRSRDLLREVDLVEEVARAVGLDEVPVHERMPVAVKPPQPRRRAITEIGRVMTGLGYDETVTFSFTTPERGGLFIDAGLRTASVDDERRGGEPTLRPSVLAGLLGCRKQNQDARSAPPGTIRLYEIASAFAEDNNSNSVEHQSLAGLIDVPGSETSAKRSAEDLQAGVRAARATVESLVRACWGPGACLVCTPIDPPTKAWRADACARVQVGVTDRDDPAILGVMGLISDEAMTAFDLETPVAGFELVLDELVARFPPASSAAPLPSFPAIERDVSLILDEAKRWEEIVSLVGGLGLDKLVAIDFVGAFRGKQVGAGKKSVTLRLVFRDPERTLRHEEVDPQIQQLVTAAKERLGAELRG